MSYLEQSVAAFRGALQVRTREQWPLDWAGMQNNLGNALDDLAQRSEEPQAVAVLEQSLEAYRSALQVRTEASFPALWAWTMAEMAHAYELKKDRSGALRSYQQLLHHDPGNIGLQSKIDELTNKN